jgi:RNA polymerase sigma-70 factor (ECF subfamily)
MDISQDTFLKLLSSIGQFRRDASFESWLYRLVVNSCLDYHRRKRRFLPLLEHGLDDAMEQALDRFRAPRESALHDLLREEQEERVQQVVAQLPEEQRIVVVLRYTEGLSYEDIAAALGCRRGTVASRLNRAHKALERRLSHLRQRKVRQ